VFDSENQNKPHLVQPFQDNVQTNLVLSAKSRQQSGSKPPLTQSRNGLYQLH